MWFVVSPRTRIRPRKTFRRNFQEYLLSDFVLKDDFRDEARDVSMSKGDVVEIVDIDKKEKWLVRNKKNLNQVRRRTSIFVVDERLFRSATDLLRST